jgi:hypothetical protein
VYNICFSRRIYICTSQCWPTSAHGCSSPPTTTSAMRSKMSGSCPKKKGMYPICEENPFSMLSNISVWLLIVDDDEQQSCAPEWIDLVQKNCIHIYFMRPYMHATMLADIMHSSVLFRNIVYISIFFEEIPYLHIMIITRQEIGEVHLLTAPSVSNYNGQGCTRILPPFLLSISICLCGVRLCRRCCRTGNSCMLRTWS